jgi:hypothetical protein
VSKLLSGDGEKYCKYENEFVRKDNTCVASRFKPKNFATNLPLRELPVFYNVLVYHRGTVENAPESTKRPYCQQNIPAATQSEKNGKGATRGARTEDFVTIGKLAPGETEDLHSDRHEHEEEE